MKSIENLNIDKVLKNRIFLISGAITFAMLGGACSADTAEVAKCSTIGIPAGEYIWKKTDRSHKQLATIKLHADGLYEQDDKDSMLSAITFPTITGRACVKSNTLVVALDTAEGLGGDIELGNIFYDIKEGALVRTLESGYVKVFVKRN